MAKRKTTSGYNLRKTAIREPYDKVLITQNKVLKKHNDTHFLVFLSVQYHPWSFDIFYELCSLKTVFVKNHGLFTKLILHHTQLTSH
jgi:hypothetical protein